MDILSDVASSLAGKLPAHEIDDLIYQIRQRHAGHQYVYSARKELHQRIDLDLPMLPPPLIARRYGVSLRTVLRRKAHARAK